MARGVKGLVVEIGGDTSGLQKSLQQAKTSSTNLTTELNKINKSLKFDTQNTDLWKQKQDVLNKSIEETSKYLEQLKQHERDVKANGLDKLTEENAKKFRELQREIASVEQKLQDLEKARSPLTKIKETAEKMGTAIQSVGAKMTNLGNQLSKISVPIIAGLTAAAKSAIDFEEAFAGVQKTVDETATTSFDKLKQGIQDMAKEVPSTTTEIAAVAEAAGQLGIKADDVLSFTKTMIDLGNSTNLSATEASSALAKFANITGTSAKDFNKLGSVIVDLGNNFATTEADIVSMATGLAATGEITGLTEPQIMALATAMSSVGIEAAAGSTAMSKLLKKIQVSVETGSKDLSQFASVAGMTGEQFKKTFEKDAVKALSAFISGLNDTERNGKSAVAVLDDMGIKEVRLSNTILSLAKAGNLLGNSIDTANKAWKEDTALVNEANKRYATTGSQLKITWNEVKNVATNLGNKLLPIIKKVLDVISGWMDKLSQLNGEQLESIVKIGLMVGAVGPLVKLMGTLTTTIGGVVKAIGALSSPIGLVVAGIGGLVAIATALANIQPKLTEEEQKYKDALDGQTKSLENYKNEMAELDKAKQEYLNKNLGELQHYEDLATELDNLVDANGRVKKGYEDRANFIANTLNGALGTEIKITDGVIQNYDTLQSKIQEVIKAKKAQILLEANEEKYKKALEEKTKKQQEYAEALENTNKFEKDLNTAIEQVAQATGLSNEAVREFITVNGQISSEKVKDLTLQYVKLGMQAGTYNKELEQNLVNVANGVVNYTEWNKTLEENRTQYQQNQDTIFDYEKALEELENKNYDAVSKIYEDTITYIGKTDEETYNNYQKQIEMQQDHIKQMQEQRNEGNEEQIKKEIESAEQKIKILQQEQAQYKQYTEEGLDGTKIAWENGLDEILSEIVGKNVTFKEDGEGNVQMYVDGIAEGETMAKDEMAEVISQSLGEITRQNPEAQKAGEDLIKGVNNGISRRDTQNSVFRTLSAFGSSLLSRLRSSLQEHSPSEATKEMGSFLLQGLGIGIDKEEDKLLKQIKELGENIVDTFDSELDTNAQLGIDTSKFDTTRLNQGKLSAGTQNINNVELKFYPQTMTEAELDKAFNYINRRLGTAY